MGVPIRCVMVAAANGHLVPDGPLEIVLQG